MPLVLFTVEFPLEQVIGALLALVIVHTTVPVGCPPPGLAAATMAEKLAPLLVTVGLALAAIVTDVGAFPTAFGNEVADEDAKPAVAP